MDFELTEEQKIVQMSIRQFMLKEIEPIAEKIERDDAFPEDIWKRLGRLGALGVTVDEQYGGSGFDLLTGVLINETIARTCPALSLSYSAHANLCADNLNRNAKEDQKGKYPTVKKIHLYILAYDNAIYSSIGIGFCTKY